MLRRVYFQGNRFKYWKSALAITGGVLILAIIISRLVVSGQAVTVQIARPPVLLDPARMSSYEEKLINGALYENLVAYDPEKHICKGILAEKWDVSQAGSVYTFFLRKGLRFHDGNPVTAQDVKTSWERLLDPGVSNCGYLLQNVDGSDEKINGASKDVRGLVVVDPYTFKVILKESDWTFPAVASSPSLAIISQKAVAGNGQAYGKSAAAIAGTGPFRLVSWAKDKLVLQRNGRHAGAKPRLKNLSFLVAKRPQEITNLYEAGKLDILTSVPAQFLSSLAGKESSKGFTVFKKPVLTLYFVGFNLRQTPFDNGDLRKAVSLAIDKAAIARELLGDGGRALSGFLPPELTPQGQAAGGTAKQDTDQAIQMLAGAGFPYGLGLPTISYAYNDSPGHDYLAHLLQEQLDKVGVDLQPKKVPWQSYEATVRSGAYPLFRLGWEADYPEPKNLLYFNFASGEKGRANLTGYKNAGFDSLLQQARGEQDANRRQEIYHKAEQMLLAETPIIPLFQQVALFGLRKGITDFDVDLLGRVDFDRLRKS